MLMHVYYNKAKILENSSQNMDALKEYQKILDYKTHYGKEWHKEMCGFCLNQQGDIYFGMKKKKKQLNVTKKHWNSTRKMLGHTISLLVFLALMTLLLLGI
mmetsp:Transcript_31347/g.28537  ORF Transcript_31347/g.28537 Transcript_31347/m.28537 type:complete len:101 (+) Transcript_31347:345-647(+)